MTLVISPASAHGSKSNLSFELMSGNGAVFLEVNDIAKDGHCADARVHMGGRWQRVARDCSHSTNTFADATVSLRSGQNVSVSFCLSGHTGGTYCEYRTVRV